MNMSYLQIVNSQERSKVWLVVEWKSAPNVHNGYCLVSSEDLADNIRLEDFHTGKVVNVKVKGGVRQACIVIVSADKHFLEMELKHLQDAVNQIGLTKRPSSHRKNESVKRKKISADQEAEDLSDQDFIESASDWSPSTDEDSEIENLKKRKGRGRKSKKSIEENNQNQKKEKISKGKKRGPKGKRKETLSGQQTGKSVITSVAHLLKNKTDPLTIQTVTTTNDVRQYLPISTAPQPQSSMTYNSPRPRVSYTPSPSEYYIIPPMTFDQQTQTNFANTDPNVTFLQENQKVMREDIVYLLKRVDEMTQKINSMQLTIEQLQYGKYERQGGLHDDYSMTPQPGPSVLREPNRISMNSSQESLKDPYSFQSSPPQSVPQIARFTPNPLAKDPPVVNMDGTDMVPLGSGKTMVSRHIYNQIKWSSYSNATRKLLMAVFPRRTLATHSLTGKCSPAFSGKPAKMQLDPKKVTDIIMTVSQMSNTPENLVRTCITTKCADENKMYRIRMENRKKNRKNSSENEENESP